MRLLLQTQRSTQISNKSLAPAVYVEAHKLPVRPGSKRTRGYRAPKYPLDRKVAHRCSRPRAVDERAADLAHEDRQAAQTRSIQSGKLWRTRGPARFFVDRSKTCT